MTVPVAALSKAYVCGRSPAEIVGSNPTGGMGQKNSRTSWSRRKSFSPPYSAGHSPGG